MNILLNTSLSVALKYVSIKNKSEIRINQDPIDPISVRRWMKQWNLKKLKQPYTKSYKVIQNHTISYKIKQAEKKRNEYEEQCFPWLMWSTKSELEGLVVWSSEHSKLAWTFCILNATEPDMYSIPSLKVSDSIWSILSMIAALKSNGNSGSKALSSRAFSFLNSSSRFNRSKLKNRRTIDQATFWS